MKTFNSKQLTVKEISDIKLSSLTRGEARLLLDDIASRRKTFRESLDVLDKVMRELSVVLSKV